MNDVELGIVRRKFGMVFQMSALFDSMSVFDNVAFLLREHTRMGAQRDPRAGHGAARRRSASTTPSTKMPSELSGGMKKRVAVARALVLEPAILIYDEPTTGLDPITSRTVDELIVHTKEKYGVTSLVISHDMASVFHIADHINYLYEGVIEATGTPRDFVETRNPATLEFLRASGVDPSTVLRA